jgi:hypothetical protein
VRVEIRFFAADSYEASRLWKRVVEICRDHTRRSVGTTEGSGVLYSFTQASGPSDLYDDSLKMDFRVAYFDAVVSEDPTEA